MEESAMSILLVITALLPLLGSLALFLNARSGTTRRRPARVALGTSRWRLWR